MKQLSICFLVSLGSKAIHQQDSKTEVDPYLKNRFYYFCLLILENLLVHLRALKPMDYD